MTKQIFSFIKKIGIHSLLLLVLIFPLFTKLTHAQASLPSPTIGVHIQNPFACGTGPCDLMSLLLAILNNIIMPIAAVAVTVWIVWAGFQFLMAQGNEKKITDAKQNLLWSLIGAGVLLGAVGISAVVKNTINALIVP